MNEANEDAKPAGGERSAVEGVDFYFEDGLMVLTETFLKERGCCCGSGCRNCPYSRVEPEAALEKKVV